MSVIKNVDDQKTIIANKSVIDHSQLANRNAYGAHSIDAIRKLPEKLTSLKNKDKELDDKITQERTERIEGDELLQANLDTVENKARQINIEEISGTGKLRFTSYGGEETKEIQAGFLPDEDTIELMSVQGITESKELPISSIQPTSSGSYGIYNYDIQIGQSTSKTVESQRYSWRITLSSATQTSGNGVKFKVDVPGKLNVVWYASSTPRGWYLYNLTTGMPTYNREEVLNNKGLSDWIDITEVGEYNLYSEDGSIYILYINFQPTGFVEPTKRLALKSVYVDGKTIVGTGARPFEVNVENKQIDSSTITEFTIDRSQFIESIHSLNMHIKNGTEIQLQYVGEQEVGVLDVNQTEDTLHIVSLPNFQAIDGTLEISNAPMETISIWKIVNINKTLSNIQLGLTIVGLAQVGDTLSFTLYTGENELQAVAIGDPTGIITPSDVRELQADNELHTNEISDLSKRVDAVEGIGGYLLPYDFDTTTPDLPEDHIVLDSEGNYDASASTLSELTQYALDQIPTITNPADIWNGTRVTNLENNHTWVLNNNYPDDFSWTDLGQALVSIATTETAGIVKSSNDDLKISVNDLTGEMTVNNLETKLGELQNYKVVDTEIDKNALTPAEGLVVYVKETDSTYIYENSKWGQITTTRRLIGETSSTPINLANDLVVGGLYVVSGYVRGRSTSYTINFSTPCLFFKTSTTTVSIYNARVGYTDSSATYNPGYVTNLSFDSSGLTLSSSWNINITSLNGSTSTTGTSIYAPTTGGTSGQLLKSNGSGAPTWVDAPSGKTDGITTTTNASDEIQAIGLINNSEIITAAQIIEALTITDV